jgi:diguanylate cyclase (GGDEF)-like protein/PAS domain S-box-containing protein
VTLAVLFSALFLHGVAIAIAGGLAFTSRKVSWIALALAVGLMGVWRTVIAYDAVGENVAADLGAELLAGVISLLTVVGMRAASRTLGKLRRSEDRLRAVVDSAMDAIIVVDDTGHIRYANAAVEHVFGRPPGSVIGQPFTLLAPDPSAAFDRATPHGDRRSVRERMTAIKGVHASGQALELEATFGTHEEDGHVQRTGIVRDVTARERLQAQLRASEERYALAAKAANDGLWDWDLKSGQMFFSPRWKQMLGIASTDPCLTPDAWFSRIHAEDAERVASRLNAHLRGISEHFDCEYRIRHENGSQRWMRARGLAVRDVHGNVERIAGSQSDVTARKLVEERLLHDALHDALTGLPNRVLFADRLDRCLARRSRSGVRPAVLFIDLDRFKNVNDSLGHTTGDRLLVEVGRKLESCVRPCDTVARLGGDEFAVLLEDVVDDAGAIQVAERVLAELSRSVRLDEHEVVTAASIGIACGDLSYRDAGELLRDADAAMYRAKELGKGRYQLFDAQLRDAAKQRLSVEAELRRGLGHGEIEVAYQPIVSLRTGRIVSFEALARWRRGTRTVPPVEFIPLAEETGLIVELERQVFDQALEQLASWQQRFAGAPLGISLNVSGRHLVDPTLVGELRSMLAEHKLTPGSVRLEITESWLLDDGAATQRVLGQLRELGLSLVIDDFGTGYSSLSYLHRLPIDGIKLDQSFVRDLESSPERAEIVRTVVSLAGHLKLEVVAEGVENSSVLARLRELGCDLAQGYFFSRPVDRETAEALVAREVEVLDATRRSDHPPATATARKRRPKNLVA